MPKKLTRSGFVRKPFGLVNILPWLVLLVGLLVTLNQWRMASDYAEETLNHRFEIAFNDVTDKLTDYVDDYAKLLRATRGHFNASDAVTREEFHTFATNLELAETFPGLMGIGYVTLIAPEDLQAYEQTIRESGFPDYQVYPDGERDIYTSILYLEPFNAGNQKAFGYDMYSETSRRKAMKRSVASDSPSLSAGVELVQGKTQINDGLLMYLPLYDDPSGKFSRFDNADGDLRTQNGWVYLVFRASDLANYILQKSRVNDLQIMDIASRRPLPLFATMGEAAGNFTAFTKTIPVAGREWQLIAKPDQMFHTDYRAGPPRQTLIIGGLLSILLACITALLVNARQKAMRLAKRMTQQFQEQNMRLRLATKTARIGIWEWDFAANTIHQEDGNNSHCDAAEKNTAAPNFNDWLARIDYVHRKQVADKLHMLAETEQEDIIDLPFLRENTGLQILQLSVGPRYDEQKNLIGLIGMTLDITDDWQTQKQLEQAESRWKHALEGSNEGVWDWLVAEERVIFSDNLIAMLGYGPDEFQPKLHKWQERVHPDDLSVMKDDLKAMLDGSCSDYRNEHRSLCKDGSWKWILDKGTVIERDAEGRPLRAIGTHSDISWRKDAELALKQSEERFRNAFDTAAIGMALVSLDGRFLEVNNSICEMLGYTDAELVNMDFMQITHPDDLELDQHYISKLLSNELDHYHMEKRYFSKSGDIIDVLLSVSVVHDDEGRIVHFVAQIEDVTVRKIEEDRIRKLAFYDELTRLPNRRLLNERLEQALLLAKRNRNSLALMFIDVDYFKNINDQYGHDIGDAVIKAVGQELRNALRASDTVARIGGDEFVVLLSEVKSSDAAQMVAGNLRQIFTEALDIPGQSLRVSLSIGVSVSGPEQHETAEQLLKKADIALYEVKATGRDGIALYQD